MAFATRQLGNEAPQSRLQVGKRQLSDWALHKKSWAVIDRPYSLGCATVGALYERPRCIFCAKPKGGVQRIYVGNVSTGDHKLEVLVDGKLEGGAYFSRTERFTIHKEVKPKLVGLTLAGSGNTPIPIGEC